VVKRQESEPAVDFGPVRPLDRRVVDGLLNQEDQLIRAQ
jgi:hypothetical protein